MPLPRPAALRGSIQSFSLKRAGTQARTSLRAVGRRTYASEHGAQKSSDLPWLIGSIVVTVPAAGWLWQQGPTKSDHGHGHEEKVVEEAPAEESKEEEESPKEDSDKDEDGKQEEGKDEGKEEGKDEGKDEEKDEEKDGGKDEGQEKSADKGENKDKEVTPKGTAIPDDKARTSEAKGAKDAQGDVSGSNNPFMGSSGEEHKPEGPAATAKIHGTVDKSKRPEEPPRPDETDQKKQPE
ncbi:hypothetical protein A1O7_08816 [Cladophialophora yegresii CBS 114405]|uniref:Cylicin I n=1 Tax=Cladophialophora yegresii CBS 114405 TaxID=1182544 RepID=W9VSC6_9EURO|nr:uncharacterized protein A1O7_08816 [Cladophialophora yegresii CBS 114405]EXJ55885.1 hypothetical protein A1O7_08816 [Cladophialophora yegresii CBS 114405]